MTCTATGDGGNAGAAGCAGSGTASVTLSNDGGSVTVQCGGVSSTVTVNINGGGGSTVSVTASTGIPSGVPNLPNSTPSSGGHTVSGGAVALSATPGGPANTPLYFVALQSSAALQLTSVPSISVTVPAGVTLPAGTSVAWYDPVLDTYTDFGNVSVNGQTLTFSGFPMAVSLKAQSLYGLVLYTKSAAGLAAGTVTVTGVPVTDDTLLLSVGQSGVSAQTGRLAAVPLYQATPVANAHCVNAAGSLSCTLTGIAAGSPAYFDGGAFAASAGAGAVDACFASSLASPVAGYLLMLNAAGGSGCPLSSEGP